MVLKTRLQIPKDDELVSFIENEDLKAVLLEFIELRQIYSAAIKEISTKLEILNDEFKIKFDHNPIRYMESRLKSPQSIYKKLQRRNYLISTDSARKNLFDIAGIRVICCYIDDIYTVKRLLLKQKDVSFLREKDYIKSPKENGYRSLHLVVSIPVFLADQTELVPVEIQIRTVAMDFWASLEHHLRYKRDKNIPLSVHKELFECAESIASLDIKMQGIFKQL